jgi:DNA-binding protein H-NS
LEIACEARRAGGASWEARAVAEWEYRKLYLNQHSPRGDELDLLNAAGAEGWELVGITNNNTAYLKREIKDPAAARSAHRASAVPNGSDATGGGAQGAMVKYRDPVTNETWLGRGRMPNWLKRKQEAGEDIEEYLV